MFSNNVHLLQIRCSLSQTNKPENIYISKCFHWLVVTVWRLLHLGVSVCRPVACDELWRAEHCQQQSERWRPVTPAPVVTQVSWCHGVTQRSVTQTVTRNEPTFPIRVNLRLGSHYRDRILIARWSCPQWSVWSVGTGSRDILIKSEPGIWSWDSLWSGHRMPRDGR